AEMGAVVPVEERKRRNQALRGLSEMKRRAFYDQFLGTVRPVLFEHHKDQALLTGFTDNYIKIEMPYTPDRLNTIAPVSLLELNAEGDALAEPAGALSFAI
ncbi:MAG: tRNA (N(6)-L-threonylcarbamoyladenosine(37)-C(2))-methylthiotransferase MtaB, partial [Bacteroidota bacterium]